MMHAMKLSQAALSKASPRDPIEARMPESLSVRPKASERYTSYEYTERLKRAGMAPSRGRTGTALDNAMAESIMSTLKRELTKRFTWRTRLDLELAVLTYVGWYNCPRKHRSLRIVEEGRIRRLSSLEMVERYNQQVATSLVAAE